MNARDARRKLDLQNIAQALEVYYQKNGRYPITGWVYSTSANWIVDSPPVDTSAVAFDSTYMSSIPQDPRENIGDLQTFNTAGFGYSFCSDKVSCYNTCSAGNGQWYMLMAQLENHNDPDTRAGGKIYKTCNGTIFTSWSQYLYIITPK